MAVLLCAGAARSGPARAAALRYPLDVAVDVAGNVYIADSANHAIRRVDPTGAITTVVGTGEPGFSGDGGPARLARLHSPYGIGVAPDGILYVADTYNNRIRAVDPSGTITTVAGNGERGFSGDGGPATNATLRAYDAFAHTDGSLYIADSFSDRIRKVDASGVITTVAGGRSSASLVPVNYSPLADIGDGGQATDAQLSFPRSVVVDGSGALCIADAGNNRIRRVAADGTIETIAGMGPPGYAGDGFDARVASLNGPVGLTFGPDGALYVADQINHRIRMIDVSGTIHTVAGAGVGAFFGDGGPAIIAALQAPGGVAFGPAGDLVIADYLNHRIRAVDRWGVITTIAGTGTPGYAGDG